MLRGIAATGQRVGTALVIASLFLAPPQRIRAQTTYQQPPEPIAKMLDAPPIPIVVPSLDGRFLLELDRPALPPIGEVAVPTLRIAGDRIDTRSTDDPRHATLTGLRIQPVDGTAEREVNLPAGARIHYVRWSPDGRRISMVVQEHLGGPLTLWTADVETGAAHSLSDRALDAAAGDPCGWLPADEGLVCRFRPADQGPVPEPAAVPVGPTIEQSSGRAVANPTYEDLLASSNDEALFDHYYTAQLARVSLSGALTPLGQPGIIVTNTPSPDGRYVLVEARHRPYSYRVPETRFPTTIEVWDASTGAVVTRIADVPLQESVPISFDAVPVGPREVRWRADQPATLSWVEAVDGGDPHQPPVDGARDHLLDVAAPFTSPPVVLDGAGYRITGVTWNRPDRAILTERWWNTRQQRTWAVDPSRPGSAPRLLFERSYEDRYADPGTFVTAAGPFGWPVLLTTADGRSAYLSGDGASQEGDRPFLDRIDLGTLRTTRLWRSEAPYYDSVAVVLDPGARRIVTRRESVHDVPQYVVRELPGGQMHQLTHFVDPAPEFANVSKQLITYARADGVELSATLYLPAGYTPAQGRLPFFFWAYPREFKSATAAAQVVGSPYRFVRPTGDSPLFMVTQGYGVLDGPTMPIVGEGTQQPNDSYVQQLVASAQAAVDKVVAMGVADRTRIAVGGHSYGAFMAANLLVHSKLFRAGVAESGAYNRTLTPFGFQAEERTFWQAPDVYLGMSPFRYADSLSAPLLLIHGIADDNTGTFPVQSERFYAALAGNGGVTRLVMLPDEAHGYRARESIGHALWEIARWLDMYVKSPASTTPKQVSANHLNE
jgi:dipeptidyl aminopeptidase/acylaminoacyl peptidase